MAAESLIIFWEPVREEKSWQAGLEPEVFPSLVQGRVRNLGALKVFFLLFSSSLS